MKLQIIVILLATFGIATGLAVIGDEQIFITVTSEGKAKVSQSLFPETFVSTIDVKVISENISNLLAIDGENIILGTSQNQELLKIATLGASAVDLKYNADILAYESGIFKLKYNSELESRVNLPPLSKLVSLNTIPIEITDEEYVLPPGEISLSFTIRPVTSKEFFVPVDDSEYKIETITAAKIEGFSANSDVIQFIIKDKAIVLTIIPTEIMANPNDALLNGEKVDFTQFHKNSTHSWIRIDPHEKGLVKILDTTEKTEEGGGCLIATATYGSEMAPQVQFLREIRDNQLMNTDSGVSFMTGFNQFYYSFSPYVADMERENPFFKEIVKIGITPLLSSLSVMEYAETDEEILGLGISVILMNIGMYFVFPFVICYQGMKIVRTRGIRQSSLVVISNCTVRSVLKITVFGLIALFVLSVSIPSAFAQSTESEGQNPIQVILDISYENIQESFVDAGISPENYPPVFTAAQEEYEEAIAALEAGDLETAEESALLAMALFEESAEEIAEQLEVQQATIQPLGLSTAAASIFNVQEAITNTDNDANELRELVKLNDYEDVDFSEYTESVNLAKTLLAEGYIPDAQAQLALADAIKDNLYDEIANNPQITADIEEYMDDQKNLGLTQKDIRELEGILENITTEETGDDVPTDSGDESPGNSGEAPGQNKSDSGDEAPGNSGEAPGQNKADSGDESPGNSGEAPGQNNDNDNDETPEELPPGFDSASDTGKANGQGNGLGLGNIPPGLAKLFGLDGTGDDTDDGEVAGLPPGLSNIPPGQLKKLDYAEYGTYSADDTFEFVSDDPIERSFEDKFDKMDKKSKSEEKKDKAEKAARDQAIGKANAKGNSGGGNPNCDDEGVTDNDPTNLSGQILVAYIVEDFTAVGSSCQVADPDNINIQVARPSGGPLNLDQGDSFTPTEAGTYTITASFQGQFGTRIVEVTGGLDADAGPDQTVNDCSDITLDGSGSTDEAPGTIVSYSWVKEAPQPNLFAEFPNSLISPSFTPDDVSSDTTYTFTLTVEDDDTNQNSDSVDITVTDGGACGSNTPPTVSATSAPTVNENATLLLDGTADDPDGDNGLMTYAWTKISGSGNPSITNDDQVDATFNAPNIGGPGADRVYVYRLTVTDEGGAQSFDEVTFTVINLNP